MNEVKPGDNVLVDVELAKKYDSSFNALTPPMSNVIMEVVDYEFKDFSGDSYAVESVEYDVPITFHIRREHIIENLSEVNYFCNQHKMEDGLYYKKYDMEFCPFCGVEREVKIKRHPLTRRISSLWNPYEKPENQDEVLPLTYELDGILLSSIPVMGMVIAIDNYGFYKDKEDNLGNIGNIYYQVMLIGIFIQVLWILAVTGLAWWILS